MRTTTQQSHTFQYNEPSSPTLVHVGQSKYAFLKYTHTEMQNFVWSTVNGCSVYVYLCETVPQAKNEIKEEKNRYKWKN